MNKIKKCGVSQKLNSISYKSCEAYVWIRLIGMGRGQPSTMKTQKYSPKVSGKYQARQFVSESLYTNCGNLDDLTAIFVMKQGSSRGAMGTAWVFPSRGPVLDSQSDSGGADLICFCATLGYSLQNHTVTGNNKPRFLTWNHRVLRI